MNGDRRRNCSEVQALESGLCLSISPYIESSCKIGRYLYICLLEINEGYIPYDMDAGPCSITLSRK